MHERLTRFLEQHNALMPAIWRCVGVCLVGNSLISASYAATAQPYLVPSLRQVADFLQLPEAAYAVYILLWLACAICGIAMVCGSRRKIFPGFAAITIALLGAMEYTTILCSYIVVELLYLIALLFDETAHKSNADSEPTGSPTPALMQVAVSSCYVWSVLQKLHPEWLSGATMMQVFRDGWELRGPFVPFVTGLHIGEPIAVVLSLGALVFELFLAAGLWFERTRKITAIAGCAFHLGLTFMFFGIEMFMPVMLTGYLAFFRNSTPAQAPANSISKSSIAAIVCIAVMVLMPMRYYFTGKPSTELTATDRVPWSFSMFLFNESVRGVTVAYQDHDGTWRSEPTIKRMERTAADKDLYALTAYVLRQHPDAVAARASCDLLINSHKPVQKTCNAYREPSGVRFSLTQK
jgi:hypothetical protein